jgi:AcrR family transcriptional regulator
LARPSKKNRRKDTRADLVADARQLILSHGYANTSVNTINARAGLSKGTFYHYFKSKSDLLDAVVDQLTQEGWRNTRHAIESTTGGAIERFRRFLAAARRWRLVALPQTAEIMRAVFRPENSLLRERMREQSISLAAPALAALLEDGNREGVFEVADSAATARVFLILAYGVSDDMMREVISSTLSDEDLLAQVVARGSAFMRATESLLGVPAGTIEGPDVELLSGMIMAFRYYEDEEASRSPAG